MGVCFCRDCGISISLNLRGSFVIALTIPFSLITAFIYLYFSHNTINIISLSSLSIALGMVVDNSIVVLENIFRHRDEENRQEENRVYSVRRRLAGQLPLPH